MADKAALIAFLACSRIDPRDGDVWDDGAIVAFFSPGTGTGKAVWTDRDKTLPDAGGLTQTTLGSDGSVTVFGDGIYDIKIYGAADSGLASPLKTFSNVNIQDGQTGAELTDPTFLDGTDATKKVTFDMSGVTSGNTRDFAFPDEDGTFALGATTTISMAGSGDFTGGEIRCSVVNNVVTVTHENLTHANATSATSAAGVIPAAYRPASAAQNIYGQVVGGDLGRVVISSAGTLSVDYWDWAGAPASKITAVYGSISYVI